MINLLFCRLYEWEIINEKDNRCLAINVNWF